MTITPEKLRQVAQQIEEDAHDIGGSGYFARAKDWLEAAAQVRAAADEIERLRSGKPTRHDSVAEVLKRSAGDAP